MNDDSPNSDATKLSGAHVESYGCPLAGLPTELQKAQQKEKTKAPEQLELNCQLKK